MKRDHDAEARDVAAVLLAEMRGRLLTLLARLRRLGLLSREECEAVQVRARRSLAVTARRRLAELQLPAARRRGQVH